MASRPEPLTAYRIADGRHPVFDGSGAALVGGRWNSPGRPLIYGSLSYACALLERLVHAGTGRIPKHQVTVVITIPASITVEEPAITVLPSDWDGSAETPARAFGDAWLAERRSCVLIVPSVVAKYERNLLINPAHPDFSLVKASAPEPVAWDARLFGR